MRDQEMRDFEGPGRSAVCALNGMAATSHPLATLTAINILQQGGNAMDAAVAACAVQCVVEPQSTGIGGDCFALYAPKGQADIIAFNGSGCTPAAAHAQWYLDNQFQEIERCSAHAVTVPGAVAAWVQLVEDHGTKSLSELLQPAIQFARDGYPLYARVVFDWQREVDTLNRTASAAETFLIDGQAPAVGAIHRQPLLAETLSLIAAQGRAGFYQGPVAEDMVTYLNSLGGLHTLDDFAAAQGEYVAPIKTNYRDYQVYECPPNGQGIAALQMLNILEGFDISAVDPLSTHRLHLQIEAKRLAYRDRDLLVADPRYSEIPITKILSKDYAQELRNAIDPQRAMHALPISVFPQHHDTVYLCVVDRDNNAVSFINSLFHSFGSALVSPQTGVCLHSRGSSFVVDPDHPNGIAPNKRPMHTIIPGMLVKDDHVVMPFGVMGGHYQAMGHAHLLSNILDFGMDVQAALDFPRVFAEQDGCVEVEGRVPFDVTTALRSMGYTPVPSIKPIGGGQAIWMDWSSGVLTGGSDPRKDGCALGY